MQQPFESSNDLTDDGTPNGGYVEGVGLQIQWQRGALVFDGERHEPNGAFVETVIAAAKQRIEHYQTTRYACKENETAIEALDNALTALRLRTADREHRGVEGTHQI